MTEKKLTDWQLKACSLISPVMGRMTHKEAAKEMGISLQAFNKVLRNAEKVKPDLFPMLTNQEYDVLQMIECGLTLEEISERLANSATDMLGVALNRVKKIIASLKRKGRNVNIQRPQMLSLENWMDGEIKEKF